jgi:hypothetical protein
MHAPHTQHAFYGGDGARAPRGGRGNPALARAGGGGAKPRGIPARGPLELDRTARARIYLPHLTDRYRLALGSVSRQTQPRAHLHLRRAHAGPPRALSRSKIYLREREML